MRKSNTNESKKRIEAFNRIYVNKNFTKEVAYEIFKDVKREVPELTEEDVSALDSIRSDRFTLDSSKYMYNGVENLRNKDGQQKD
jgi:hypothetical protein